MNLEEIRALAEILTQNGLTSLEVETDSAKVKLKKDTNGIVVSPAAYAPAVAAPAENVAAVEANVGAIEAAPVDFNNAVEVISPIVGVFYSAPSPESDPYVTIGSRVEKGDVLCVIEAMKLMNEITAEQDGEIVDICIKNGDIAEFGQVLFKMC